MDPLTRLPGRRSMEHTLKQLGKRYTIAMLDIDHFKKLNDQYGHDVGDQVLKMVAKQIKKVTGGGKPARYGGEEFAIIFPGKTVLDVVPHVESVRLHIQNTPFFLRDKERPQKMPKDSRQRSSKPKDRVNVTISIGVAERTRIHRSTDKVMKAADENLYTAKKKGRNQVCYS
ncbi:MAG: GGDEF domain-containing protein, partial [Gammaproteobacteria bacterium]|nr:GGDEF domain-containing protein [Gammaproteobacteria bacterium]